MELGRYHTFHDYVLNGNSPERLDEDPKRRQVTGCSPKDDEYETERPITESTVKVNAEAGEQAAAEDVVSAVKSAARAEEDGIAAVGHDSGTGLTSTTESEGVCGGKKEQTVELGVHEAVEHMVRFPWHLCRKWQQMQQLCYHGDIRADDEITVITAALRQFWC